MTSRPDFTLTDRRRPAAATTPPGADAPHPGPATKPPRQDAPAPAHRDTVLGDLVFLLRFAFGRY